MMNKHVKISLTVLIAVIILLAIALPGLAKKSEPEYTCLISPRVINSGGVIQFVDVYVELDAYWEEGVLYNYCTWIVPWGEEYNAGWRYLTFEEACDDFAQYGATCTKNILSLEQEDWPYDVRIYDPAAEEYYYATDSLVTIHRKTGELLWSKVYIPTPEE